MNPASIDFLASAMCKRHSTADFLRWFDSRRRATRAVVERVPLRAMKGWSFETSTGNLMHETGRFFKVEGAWVETNFGFKPQWTQPIEAIQTHAWESFTAALRQDAAFIEQIKTSTETAHENYSMGLPGRV